MAETSATILITDISGFTEFMTNTELSHGSMAINMLIDAIVKAVDEDYEVAEIEGDAVLLVRKGSAPSKEEIEDMCLKIFRAFHFHRKWMQQHAVCPCGACLSLSDLTLKFVAHHGPVAEMKVGRFVKQAGLAMIVAHRLLKNSINNNEYLLITDNLLSYSTHDSKNGGLEWVSSSEEYAAIGKVPYGFTLLNKVRKEVPEPPELPPYPFIDDVPDFESHIAVNFRDAYMVVMNIPGRAEWMPGLQKVEQAMPQVFIGSVHHCTFENYQAIVSPLRMTLSADGIVYAESCSIEKMHVSVVYEYVFRRMDDKTCSVACRLMNASAFPMSADANDLLRDGFQQIPEKLAAFCAKMEGSMFEPAFQQN